MTEKNSIKTAQKSGAKKIVDMSTTAAAAEIPEKLAAKWAKIVQKFPEANILQSPKYAKMNELLGDKAIIEDFDGQGWVLMIVRSAKRGRYLEIPCGPLIDWQNKDLIRQVFAKIKEVGKQEKCVFVRVRPQLLKTEENLQILADLKLKKSPMHLAAEHTVMVDLAPTTEEMLARMRRQTRYDVRRAGKLGITVEKGNSEALMREFHTVQAETAGRQNFVPPSLKTLLAEREAFGDDIMIYVARTGENAEKTGDAEKTKGAEKIVDASTSADTAKDDAATKSDAPAPDTPIAYGLILRAGEEGDYYEAASTPLNHKLPGADAVLWQAIQDLKEAGYKRFNLWGIAPPGQKNHRYSGVTTFKTGFGGEVVEFVPAHDLVLEPARYLKDWVVETARRARRHL